MAIMRLFVIKKKCFNRLTVLIYIYIYIYTYTVYALDSSGALCSFKNIIMSCTLTV